MPENIESLLASFGVEPEAGTPTPDPVPTPADPTPDPTPAPADPAVPVADPVKDPAPAPAPEDKTPSVEDQLDREKADKAFANMRVENTKYKKLIQTLMRGSKYTGDESAFIETLETEAYKQAAQAQGLAANPEILRKVDQQEERIQELTQSQKNQTLLLGLKTLQTSNNLNGKEVETFVQRAIENNIDLLAPGINFDALYKGMFFDEIYAKKLEEERQKWIKQDSKANDAATPDGKSSKSTPAPTDVKTMTELNSLLNSVSKEIK